MKGMLSFLNERAFPGMVLFALDPPELPKGSVQGSCPQSSLEALCIGLAPCLNIPQRPEVAEGPLGPKIVQREPIRLSAEKGELEISYQTRVGVESWSLTMRDFRDALVGMVVSRLAGTD